MRNANMYGIAIGVVVLAGAAYGQSESKTTSPLRHEGMIDAPVQDVWKAFTTSEGLTSWMAPLADIDLRVGGKMRVNYEAAGTLGDEKTIENTILSFEPQRLLSIRATKPPAGFPYPEAIKDMWTHIYFEPIGPDRTRVSVVSMGFGDSSESVKMREFFDKGNAYTVEKLRSRFARGASAADIDPLTVLHRLVGGEWTFENKRDNGSIFRGRSVTEKGPDGKSLVTRGWLGDAEGMFFHHAGQIWRDPETKTIRFQALDENGAVATGEISPKSGDAVSWDWNMAAQSGRKAHYRVDMTFQDADHYEFVLHEIKADGTTPERVRVNYTRVAETPEPYRKLKAATN